MDAAFRVPAGVVFGCVVEEGRIACGMNVTVIAENGGAAHDAIVLRLRRFKDYVDSVADGQFVDGQFGMLVDPPYVGPLPARVTG